MTQVYLLDDCSLPLQVFAPFYEVRVRRLPGTLDLPRTDLDLVVS